MIKTSKHQQHIAPNRSIKSTAYSSHARTPPKHLEATTSSKMIMILEESNDSASAEVDVHVIEARASGQAGDSHDVSWRSNTTQHSTT